MALRRGRRRRWHQSAPGATCCCKRHVSPGHRAPVVAGLACLVGAVAVALDLSTDLRPRPDRATTYREPTTPRLVRARPVCAFAFRSADAKRTPTRARNVRGPHARVTPTLVACPDGVHWDGSSRIPDGLWTQQGLARHRRL